MLPRYHLRVPDPADTMERRLRYWYEPSEEQIVAWEKYCIVRDYLSVRSPLEIPDYLGVGWLLLKLL